MLRVGISGLFLKPTQVGGAEFMLQGLLVGLLQLPAVTVILFLPAAAIAWVETLPLEPNQRQRLTTVPITWRGNRFLSESWEIPQLTRRYQLDGLIYPNYFTPWQWRRTYTVATVIHDLNYAHFPEFFSWKKRLWLNLAHRLTLGQADHTIAISEFVRQDIQTVYAAPATSITALPNAILWSRFNHPQHPPGAPRSPFILSVAHHYQHKNLGTLIRAFKQLPTDLSHLHLVLVGQLPAALVGMRRDRCEDLPALVQTLGLQDRIHVTGYLSDAELAWYYRQATLFAYPSLFEGFGMPPVEALGMGLSVLTTRCTAIPEVTLELAHYVERPLDPQEWSTRLTAILRSPGQFRPSATEISQIRATYDPSAIAQRLVTMMMNGRQLPKNP